MEKEYQLLTEVDEVQVTCSQSEEINMTSCPTSKHATTDRAHNSVNSFGN
jgi:hypothetical protein